MQIKELDNGDMEVTYQGLAIVVISPAGDVVLKTQGWFDQGTLTAINYTLRPLKMEVRCPPCSLCHEAAMCCLS